ncbi:hypothetical protein [Paenibacillus sp. HB172176]|uniref:hypothetical protein n=1 Tax=Paenibacillus sp. HB172176 TaxID=2493690 RepID=UPI00143C2DB1|nr:hypothetical protein [Paenibacillus sp. HB172176]
MYGYTGSIRGIASTQVYTPVQPVTKYGAYRTSEREEAEQSRQLEQRAWGVQYAKAAEKAANWISLAKTTQKKLTGMQQALGRDNGIRNDDSLHEQLRSLADMLNNLGDAYQGQASSIRSEVWESIELALRHPAMEASGIERDGDMRFQYRSTDANSDSLSRGLLGSEGLLQSLKHALSYAEQRKAIDLLQLPFPAAYPYALYYGGMSTYWPLPLRGVVLNKYY